VPIGITPLITPAIANKVIDTLGWVEFALYGLAVDYSNISYSSSSPSCSTGQCGSVKNPEDDGLHEIVSLCGQCRDESDLGNMMFGLGGVARGYSWNSVLGSALLYNGLADNPADGKEFLRVTIGSADGYGAFPGWVIGAGKLYNYRFSFCIAANIPVLGRDNSDQINGCQACNGEYGGGEREPNSLREIGASGATIPKLQRMINDLFDKIFVR
jgi:hypothetical protein